MKTRTISVKGSEITVSRKEQEDFISLTDIARYKNPNEPIDIIKNWLRSRTTIEFIGLWEQLHNPHFKRGNFRECRGAACRAFRPTGVRFSDAQSGRGKRRP
jgi:hypothetical protein